MNKRSTRLPLVTSIRSRRARGQAGVTLLEVLVVASVSVILATAVGAWMVATLRAGDVGRRAAETSTMLSVVNSKVGRDVAGAQFAAASIGPGGARPDGELVDCPGGSGDGAKSGKVMLVLVTPADRRVVYKLVDQTAGVGKAMYRRECANLKALGGPNDPTLNDPVPAFLNSPQGADATDPTSSTLVVKGLRSVELTDSVTSCPPSAADKNGVTYDINCQSVSMALGVDGLEKPVTYVATRRTDTYCAPNCPPTAMFTVSNLAPASGESVTFNAQLSSDRRNDYRPPAAALVSSGTIANVDAAPDWYANHPAERLHYHWNFDTTQTVTDENGQTKVVQCRPPQNPGDPEWGQDAGTIYGGAGYDSSNPVPYSPTESFGSDQPTAAQTFDFRTTCSEYLVTLTVTNASGRQSSFSRKIKVQGQRPVVRITNAAPVRVVRNQQMTFSSEVQTKEAPLDVTQSFWDFGDGTPAIPLVAANSNGFPTNCSAAVPNCTASNNVVQHKFAQAGIYTVMLQGTDTAGLSTISLITVTVDSEYYYVSTTFGDNSADCGPIYPDYKPCKTIGFGLGRAKADGKTDVIVAKGSYPAFQAVEGIDVAGGRDDAGREAATWVYAASTPTTVQGLANNQPPSLRSVVVDGIRGHTVIADMTMAPGSSSADTPLQGIYVNGSIGVVFRNVTVQPGSGMNPTGILITGGSTVDVEKSKVDSGTPIAPLGNDPANRSAYGIRATGHSVVTVDGGTITSKPGIAGLAGSAGADAGSTACSGAGGADYTQTAAAACDPTTAIPSGVGTSGNAGGGGGTPGYWHILWSVGGGDGGHGTPTLANAGADGAGGAGGGWGWYATPRPGVGEPGRGGAGAVSGGSGGVAGSRTWASADDLWVGPDPVATNNGNAAAASGQAGGGAGGGGGTWSVCGVDTGGFAGSSGGGGGGGGAPASLTTGQLKNIGSAGRAGGGSFGVYAHDSDVTVRGSAQVIAAAGGNGGAGGAGGRGGAGGKGGNANSQCVGGDAGGGGGGGGGAGAGGGGGGASGPAVAVFSVGTNASVPSVANADLRFSTAAQPGVGGAGGAGGSGGSGGSSDGDGKAGVAGKQGADGAKGADGETGLACKMFSSAAIPPSGLPCFSSSVLSITRSPAKVLTNAGGANGTLSWKVKFETPVTGLTASNFATTGSGVTAGAITVGTQGTDEVTVTVAGITGNGTIALQVVNVTGVKDGGGAQIKDPTPMPFKGESFTVDQVAPTIQSIERETAPTTKNSTVSWYVTFSEAMQVDVNNAAFALPSGSFSLVQAGVTSNGITSIKKVDGTTATFLVTAGNVRGDGTISLNVTQQVGAIKDEAGNGVVVGANGPAYTIDQTPPRVLKVTRSVGVARVNRLDEVKWTVEFSEAVSGLQATGVASNFVVRDVNGIGATITHMDVDPSGLTVVLTASTGTGQRRGQLMLDVVRAGAVVDAVGNALAVDGTGTPLNTAASTGPAADGVHEDFIVDTQPPTVVITRGAAGPVSQFTNSTTTVQWTAKFAEPVFGANDPTRFELVCGTACLPSAPFVGPAVTAVANPSGDNQTFVVTATFLGPSQSGSGQLQLNLSTAGAAQVKDEAGNASSFTPGEAYVVDRNKPTATAVKSPSDPWTNVLPGVTVTFTPVDPSQNSIASGVKETRYTVDGSDPTTNGIVAVSNAMSVNPAGVTTVKYSSLDNAGNWGDPQSIVVNIDRTLPTVSADLNDSPELATIDGVVTAYAFAGVTVTPADTGGAGVKSVTYRIDSGIPTTVLRSDGQTAKFKVRQPGSHTVEYWSTDAAGNDSTHGSLVFTVVSRGPKITGIDISSCASGGATVFTVPEGHPLYPFLSGTKGAYVGAGCVTLTAQGVQPFAAGLNPVKVVYYRCQGLTGQCDADTGEKLGESTDPGVGNDWPLSVPDRLGGVSGFALPTIERGYRIVAVVWDDGGGDVDLLASTTTKVWNVGLDLTAPSASLAPAVNGKR